MPQVMISTIRGTPQTRNIGHPNIAGVSSCFDENNTSYFVMDYIEGVSFKSYIANNGGKVSVDEALNVMIPVLRALTAVHAGDSSTVTSPRTTSTYPRTVT